MPVGDSGEGRVWAETEWREVTLPAINDVGVGPLSVVTSRALTVRDHEGRLLDRLEAGEARRYYVRTFTAPIPASRWTRLLVWFGLARLRERRWLGWAIDREG